MVKTLGALLAFRAITSRLFWQVGVMLVLLFIIALYMNENFRKAKYWFR